jgi:hypothetical protein
MLASWAKRRIAANSNDGRWMYLPRIVTPDPSMPFTIAPVPIRLSLAIMFYAQSTIGITKRVASQFLLQGNG